MKEKECLQCGKQFKPKRSTSKYCSQECQWLSMTKRDLSIHICKVCGKEFTLNRTGLKGYYCSRECSYLDEANPMYDHSVQIDEANKRKKYGQELKEAKAECKQRLKEIDSQLKELSRFTECKVCGRMFKSYNGSVFCSDDCRRKYKNNIRPTKRIKKNGKPDYSISLKKLYKRDNGRCSLCGGICNWNDYIIKDNNFIAGDYYPSIDHIKPISKGGLHEWNNIQLAHRICNTNKRDRYTLGGGSLNF